MIYFAGCNKQMVVALLCATVGFNGLNFSSVSCNHIDIAPNFAGTLMGFTNSIANTMGFLAPQIIGKIIDGHVSNNELPSTRIFLLLRIFLSYFQEGVADPKIYAMYF